MADRTTPTAEYISYKEMQIAALLQVSSPSLFVNKGDRDNQGIYDENAKFIPKGLIVGSVGARFETPGRPEERMEYQHMLITREQIHQKKVTGRQVMQIKKPSCRTGQAFME